MIPEPFIHICSFLKNNPPSLSLSGNARFDSRASEKAVTSHIINSVREYQIYSPNLSAGQKVDNNWYDIKVEDFFCDIKISELKHADNTGSARHIFYLLTEKNPLKLVKEYLKK